MELYGEYLSPYNSFLYRHIFLFINIWRIGVGIDATAGGSGMGSTQDSSLSMRR